MNVTNQTNPIENAVVSIYDKYNTFIESKNTSSNGSTEEFIVTQYMENTSGKHYYTPHNITAEHFVYGSNTDSETINESKTIHIMLWTWEITFNVTSGEDGSELDNVNIYCNYDSFEQGDDTTNPYGPYMFPQGSWSCTFERTKIELLEARFLRGEVSEETYWKLKAKFDRK